MLKLMYDELLSRFAFNLNMRHYNMDVLIWAREHGRGFHSSTHQLNLSMFWSASRCVSGL